MLRQWYYLIAGIFVLGGYFGPWIDHDVAGLVVTGLDLGEYVKFLPVVQNREVILWREGFYLPLVAVSVACSLIAYRRGVTQRDGANRQQLAQWSARLLLLGMAAIAALNMLPPAWTPDRMMTAEFRLQANAIVGCLAGVAVSPLLALLPRMTYQLLIPLLSAVALWYPVSQFWRILPAISEVYNKPQTFGWGVYVMIVGLVALGLLSLLPTSAEQS